MALPRRRRQIGPGTADSQAAEPGGPQARHLLQFARRELVKTRLLELADRGVDGIYFDSWHMPEVCTCENCQAAYRQETGQAMNLAAKRGSDDYRPHGRSSSPGRSCGTSSTGNRPSRRSIRTSSSPSAVRSIRASTLRCRSRRRCWRSPTRARRSSPSRSAAFSLGPPLRDDQAKSRRPLLDDSFALPAYDLQNALGWSLTRDSCDGRPPLMWIPFTQNRGGSAVLDRRRRFVRLHRLHPSDGLWTRRSPSIQASAAGIYRSSYELGDQVSPWLASTRPLRFALIHISERSRNARIADPRALWVEFFAPILGAFETLKEDHLPVATINDLQLDGRFRRKPAC